MIGSSENRISYNGNGIATEFAYTFKILEKSDIKVLHVAADGTETLLTKDYYVDMDKSVVLYPGYAPGEEIPEQNRPPILSEGEMLVLYREVPITQESALDKHWPFNVIENGLDKLTIICQQIWDRLQRSFYVSESTRSTFDPKVPIEAGKTFRVKDDGSGFEVTEDPAKVLPLAQGVYAQTKEQAEFAKEQADASSEAASAAKTSETNAKNYSENVNVFLPSVSDSGVLSWTNKAGLPNPASVNIKGDTGAQGLKGDKGDTGTAATIEVGTVTTGAAGSSASVVNRGDANNAILDFILPKGADGKGSVITVNGKEPDAGGNVDLDIISIANGGTGATTASKARENLGLATVASTGSYNDLSNKPTIPSAYNLPTASASVLGGIKVGSGLSISSGVLSASGGGDAYKIPYGTSSTSYTAGAKVATISNGVSFSLQAGVVVAVKFTHKYGIGDISTLNVNSTGAKTVYVHYSNNNGNDTPNTIEQFNNVYLFVYDGSNWNTVSACT